MAFRTPSDGLALSVHPVILAGLEDKSREN